jgi:hypothetical protein
VTSPTDWILNDVPQPVFALGMFSLLVVANVIGVRGRRYRDRKRPGHELNPMQESQVVSAVLGLLALLMGFTFSMAADRYKDRGLLVTEEASAISSTYLMAQAFAEPHRSELSKIVVAYVDRRIAFARETHAQRRSTLLHEYRQIQTDLWSAALAAAHGSEGGPPAGFLGMVTNAIDAADRRRAGRHAHLPTRVHMMLIVYMLITACVMGFAYANRPQYATSGTLFVLLTMSMLLIIDLDRPTSGAIIETQYAMEELQARLAEIPPSAFDHAPTPVPKSPTP